VYFICEKAGAYQSAARMLLKNERKKNNTPAAVQVIFRDPNRLSPAVTKMKLLEAPSIKVLSSPVRPPLDPSPPLFTARQNDE
jgi:hypothetical protein